MSKRVVFFIFLITVLEAKGDIVDLIENNISKITNKVSQKFSKITEKEQKSDDFKAIYKKEIKDIWEDIIVKLENSLELEKERDQAPNHAIFSKDKGSIQKDINEIFDDTLKIILDGELFEYREDLNTLQERIDTLEKKILTYREKRVIAPTTSIMATTKSGYDKKIEEARKEIEASKASIEQIKSRLSKNLKFIGINLTPKQIDVLLSRVDGDDIIQMTITMEVLKEITYQLSEIMKESSNNLKYAKKYYGMHMVLVEMVAWIQQKLIQKYNKEYIPNIDKIIDDSSKMIDKTKDAISKESDASRIKIYRQNLLTQEYTNKIAKRYKQDLLQKLAQLKKSLAITLKDVKLAKNTYKTVSLSEDLFKVIADSQKALDAVIKLQVPKIIPFDSEIVKNKYKELTQQIKSIKQ